MTNTEAIKIIIRIIDQIVNEPEPTGQIVIDINREVKHIRRTYDIEPERERCESKEHFVPHRPSLQGLW